MLKFLTLIFIPLLSFGQADVEKIKTVLFNQENAWNRGDINAFMLGYWNSEKLEFSSDEKTTYGWANILLMYKTNYPTKAKMGKLQFQIIDIKLTSDTIAMVQGKWALTKLSDNSWEGEFLLTFKRFNADWLIIKDYTTSK